MAPKDGGDWRIKLLRDVQERFERYVISPTEVRLKKIREQLTSKLASVKGPDANIRAAALRREIGRVDRIKRRVTQTQERARKRFRQQIASPRRRRSTV